MLVTYTVIIKLYTYYINNSQDVKVVVGKKDGYEIYLRFLHSNKK